MFAGHMVSEGAPGRLTASFNPDHPMTIKVNVLFVLGSNNVIWPLCKVSGDLLFIRFEFLCHRAQPKGSNC